MRNSWSISVGKLRGRDHSEDLSVDGKIMDLREIMGEVVAY
jgi:hypothetical protein